MSQRLLVSARKGLFVFERDAGAWRLAHHAFAGDHVAYACADPRSGRILAALDLGHFGAKLHASEDGGTSWNELAVPAFGADDFVEMGDGKPPRAATLKKLWVLAPGAGSQPGRLWAGTIPGGLFRSDDGGASWSLMRGLWDRDERRQWFGGGYDEPGIHSICVDPRAPHCVRIAISTGGVWRSDDDGETWSSSARGMYNTYMPAERREDANVQDVHRMVQCAAAPDMLWAQHHNAAFVSSDGGALWRDLTTLHPSVFGFAVAVHPLEPDTAWFVPAVKDEKRYPVDARLVVSRTRDGGASFEVLRNGLPDESAYDLVYRHGLAVDRDGTALAIGSTTGGLWTSHDGGERWQLCPVRLPPVYAVEFA